MKQTILILLVAAVAATASTVPEFSAQDIEGTTRNFDELLGPKLTIISFWSTTCAPCKAELGFLDSLYGVYADSGLRIVAVNIDSKRSLAKVAPIVTSQGWGFEVLTDPQGDLMRLFKVGGIPHSIYIKPDKTIIKKVTGFTKKDEAEVAETILAALHEDRPTFSIGDPMPVKRSSSVELELEEDAEIEVFLADTLGNVISTLHSGKLAAGSHVIEIKADDLEAGSYTVIATRGEENQQSELLILD